MGILDDALAAGKSAANVILGNTVGLIFRGKTGNVDPWTLDAIKDEAAASNVKALGPNATPEQKQRADAQARAEIDAYLHSTGAHPDDAPAIRLPDGSPLDLKKVQTVVNWSLGILAVGAGLYFVSKFVEVGKLFKK